MEEHAFKRIQKDVTKGTLPKVFLLCGKEQFLVEWAKNLVINKYISPASKVLDLTIIDEQDLSYSLSASSSGTKPSTLGFIIENCETLPLLSEKKIVLVKESKLLSSGEKDEGKNSELGKFCAYLGNLPDSTIIVFMANSVDRKKKLPKAILKHGDIYDFDQLSRRELILFADKRFKAGGVSVPGNVMEYMIDTTGYFNKESDYNLYTFSNDISKMIALADGGTLTEEIVKETVESDLETFIFSLLNSISDDRKDRAFKLLHNIVSERNDVSGLVALIVGQFETMYSIKELMNNKVPDRVIADKLGIKEGRLKALRPFTFNYSLSELRKNLENAYEIDRNIKTGRLKAHLALELFVAQL